MHGDVIHYRQIGRVVVAPPEPYVERRGTGRAIWAHLVPIGTVTTITPRNGGEPYREWFQRGALRMGYPPPPFSVNHLLEGGTRVGSVLKLVENVAWTDGIMLVDDNEVGDAFLAHVDPDGGRLPISIAFKPVSSVEFPGEGIMRTKVELTEVSVAPGGAAYPGAFAYARGNPPPPTAKRRT